MVIQYNGLSAETGYINSLYCTFFRNRLYQQFALWSSYCRPKLHKVITTLYIQNTFKKTVYVSPERARYVGLTAGAILYWAKLLMRKEWPNFTPEPSSDVCCSDVEVMSRSPTIWYDARFRSKLVYTKEGFGVFGSR